MDHRVYTIRKDNWRDSLEQLLNAAGLPERIRSSPLVIVKPNLVESLPPPVTTPVGLVDALIGYLKEKSPSSRIIVAEGTGAIDYDTFHCFESLGYTRMAAVRRVELIDLNAAPLLKKNNPDCGRWPELFLPAILDAAFLLSVPVLKVHSLAGVTLTMKNMMGCVPPSHYRRGNSWGKSAFHSGIDAAIFDLNRYRSPDFTLLDATVGMVQNHLWGRHCQPPVGKLACGWDPVAIDSYGALLLGKKWQDVGHIRLAHLILGNAEPVDPVDCELSAAVCRDGC
ncbi:MAG: DUF362 domain-containing protein [Desulforhopalus sp.]